MPKEKGYGYEGYTKPEYEAKNKPIGKEVNDSLHNGQVTSGASGASHMAEKNNPSRKKGRGY